MVHFYETESTEIGMNGIFEAGNFVWGLGFNEENKINFLLFIENTGHKNIIGEINLNCH